MHERAVETVNPAGELQWGRGFSTAEICQVRCCAAERMRRFNGAAVFQPRKCDSRLHACQPAQIGLQWGRGFSTAEMLGTARQAAAQTSELQWGRGLSTAETCGAAGSRRRLQVVLQWGRGLSTAEMAMAVERAEGAVLQWGRGLSTAEMQVDGLLRSVNQALQWGRGLSTAEMIA